MPVYIPYILTGKWEFGKGPWKLWLLLDNLMCTASSFNIALISYDRYLSVTKAVSYRILQRMTSKTVIMMGAIWVFAFLLYGPAIIIWEYVAGCSIVPDDECYPEFIYNWYFTLCASVFEFFISLISIAYFNFHIFQNIQKCL
ncbi:PREDICTED: histamine H3 receptor-like [Gavialis gangeticus]|uniref:histamine H3 receptor-like n=1 Tax=Gavialis gangeticus TaxID=94835 RepID=UPI00092EEF04|nr:PREDICTED: histamine H3 receptor-like [Gavialis gangeticus]